MNKILKYSVLPVLMFLFTGARLDSQTVSNVFITGNNTVGSVLTGHQTLNGITNQDIAYYWYSSSPRSQLSAGSASYTISSTDLGDSIYFKVLVLRNGTHDTIATDSSALSLPVVANSLPSVLSKQIVGEKKTGKTVYGVYTYYDLENDPESGTTFRWRVADNASGLNETDISGETGTSLGIPAGYINKYVKFYVTPRSSSGSSPGLEDSSPWYGPFTNSPPVASSVSISGASRDLGATLIGSYTYTDADGDAESGSTYSWLSSTSQGGTYTSLGVTTIAYSIREGEEGRWYKFSVTPRSSNGSVGSAVTSPVGFGPANTRPSAGNLHIYGTLEKGVTIKARFTYHDADNDLPGLHIFRWYRDTLMVKESTDSTYTLTSDDVGYRFKFYVIPVSITGKPSSGNLVQGTFEGPVTDHSAIPPDASGICISGSRQTGSELRGRYAYVKTSYKEGNSIYYWTVDGVVVKTGVGDSYRKYVLQSSDIGKEIRFGVMPVDNQGNSNSIRYSEPLARFTMPSTSFSVLDADIKLSAVPDSGKFEGTGVTNDYFSPKTAGYLGSPYSLKYTYTWTYDEHYCTQVAYQNVSVSNVNVSILGFNQFYCSNDSKDTVVIINVPAGYTDRKFTISDSSAVIRTINDTIIFNPSKLRPGYGYNTLTYLATGTGMDTLRRTMVFDIEEVVKPVISSLEAKTIFCSNDNEFVLKAKPGSGAFKGIPVFNDTIFKPSGLAGDYNVDYRYSTVRGCSDSIRVGVTINPAPHPDFVLRDTCITAPDDSIAFVNKTPLIPVVSSTTWTVSYMGTNYVFNRDSIRFLFSQGGEHDVTLKVQTDKNCTSEVKKGIDVGVKPVADFYFRGDCYSPGTNIILRDTTPFVPGITSHVWKFENDPNSYDAKILNYPKNSFGYLRFTYTVGTKYKNCSDTREDSIFIRPTIPVTPDLLYEENFEKAGQGGWFNGYEGINRWTFGLPQGQYIDHPYSGQKAWFTNFGNGSTPDTIPVNYSVMSPCFDFTSLKRPMISMMLWKRFDRNHDGAALLYQIGDGNPEYIGTLDDGINWYNSTLIKGKPGGEQQGWTAGYGDIKDTNWVESKHTLDELAGKKDVKFSLVYGSDGSAQESDGIALDDILITERTRGVLFEHFTNMISTDATKVAPDVKRVSDLMNEDVINIQYHTNFPGTDQFYTDNPEDANARFLFYGLSRAPYSFIDGGTRLNYASISDHFAGVMLDINDLTRRSLIKPTFLIELDANVSSGILGVSATIRSLDDISASNITLYLAVVEDTCIINGKSYYNIFRKLVPDAGGISLDRNWTKGKEVEKKDIYWKIEKLSSKTSFKVIAFIQNNITKQVYQAEVKSFLDIAVGVDKINAAGEDILLYPNPTNGNLTIRFAGESFYDRDIRIFDLSGNLVRSYNAGSGEREYVIDNLGLKNGLYTVKVSVKGKLQSYKKLVIASH
ncbi:MAG: T9SS type A sorting domain-containing protein [Bacteroidales bacterium]